MLILLTALPDQEEKRAPGNLDVPWHAVGALTMETINSNVHQPPQGISLQSPQPLNPSQRNPLRAVYDRRPPSSTQSFPKISKGLKP